MNRSDVTTSARLAGQVERYHTWPVHRRQSVGEHTWQIMRIYFQVFGPMSEEVSTALVWHDAGELAVGDVPFPVKARNPDIKAAFDRLESAAVAAMGGPAGSDYLLDRERVRCKVADLLEMWEFGRHELALGNTFAQPIVDDTAAAAGDLLALLSSEDRQRVEAYVGAWRSSWKSSAQGT